jgi:acyl-CoA thioester hydrolase
MWEKHKYSRKANYYETDQMGIVHHSNYIRYFEEARLDWMNTRVVQYRDMETAGVIIPVLSVDCQYKHPVRFDDSMEIFVHLTDYDGLRMSFEYELYLKESGILCVTGHTSHCFLNHDLSPVILMKINPQMGKKMIEIAVEEGAKGNYRRGMKYITQE